METNNENSNKLPLVSRLSYSLTDGCGNLLYCIIGSYLLYFYTDVYGLSIAATGAILLMTRLLDAVDAPVWGFIVDHTKTKYGQSRPYFLWLSIPFAVFMWLTFTTPNLSGTAKVVYAVVTYILAGVTYTGIQTAITAILPNLTSRLGERIILNTFRMTGGAVGAFICMTFTLPLVEYFGGGNKQLGFSITVAFFGIIAASLLIFAFKNLKEVNTERLKRIPIKDSVKAIKGNWPWILIVTANLIFWIGLTIRQSTVVYYCQYYLNDKSMIALLNGMITIGVIGTLLIPFFVKYLHKYGVMIGGLIILIIAHVALFFVDTNINLLIAIWIFSAFGHFIACSMPFAMLSDTVDFGEWKTGIRAAGFLTAIGSAFCIKAGSGIGGFIPAMFLNMFGYIPNQIQSSSSILGIKLIFTLIPALVFALGIIPLLFYRKYEANENKVALDLAERNNLK